MNLLTNIFGNLLDEPSQAFLRPVQLIGDVGTGKTCTTIRFGSDLEQTAKVRKINLKHVYVNLKLQGSSRTVLYRYIINRTAPEIHTGNLGGDDMLVQLLKYLQSKKLFLIISLDEIEYFMKHTGEHIIYDLTRLDELTPNEPCGVVGLIVISRGTDYYRYLDKSELSTLGRSCVEFRPYTSGQIKDILLARVDEAFKKDAVSEGVIELISDITASPPVCGDVRYALDLLLFAGNLADNEGSKTLRLDYVRRIHGETYHQITSQDIAELPDAEKLVLLAVARTLRKMKSAYVTYRDIQDECAMLSESLNVKLGDLDYTVQDLNDRGIIDVKSLVQIGIRNVPTDDLVKYLDNLVERVRSELTDHGKK